MSQPLAKPTGVLLRDHIANLLTRIDGEIVPRRSFVMAKYRRLAGGDLAELTREAARWHDVGKQHRKWQLACRRDFEAWCAWRDAGRIGAEPFGRHLRKSGIRHEMDSLKRFRARFAAGRQPVAAAIAAHHGHLSHRDAERWRKDDDGAFNQAWREMTGLSAELDETSSLGDALLRRYAFSGPRSWLRLADHRASAIEDGSAVPALAPFDYHFPFDEPRGPQVLVHQLWDLPVALLRAPTGSGKTDAALLWAQHQVQSGRADRLVIAMPTRFTANALAITLADQLSQTGLYHSSSWYRQYGQPADQSEAELQIAVAHQQIAYLLETAVTVTTIDHLCMSLTGAREDDHAVFFNLAHACVVVDEADFYDGFTQRSVSVLSEALRILEVPLLVMSASLPDTAAGTYGALDIAEDAFDADLVRAGISILPAAVCQPDDAASLLRLLLASHEPAIIYANTVARAQAWYQWLCDNGVPRDELLLYHSRFREPHRLIKEDRLAAMLGPQAWKRGRAHGIAILTQIGEISVNISANQMVSEMCPIDRLVQRIGRLSRFSHEPGRLHIVRPARRDGHGTVSDYPAPYGSYSAEGWQPAPALSATTALLADGEYTARQLTRLVNQVYLRPAAPTPAATANANGLEMLIRSHWLILPGEDLDDDAVDTKNWRCRDIEPQITVMVEMDSGGQFDGEEVPEYRNRREWKAAVLEHGIACRQWEALAARDAGQVQRVTFALGGDGHEAVMAWVAAQGCYSLEYGLRFGEHGETSEDAW